MHFSQYSVSELIQKVKKISIWKAVYYNLFCRNIVRKKGCYIIPFKNSVIDLDRTSRIYLNASLHIGINKLNGSKAETYIRMLQNAKWIVHNDAYLFYGTNVEIFNNAMFESGFFTANTGSIIIIGKKVVFHENVMIGRNVTIYDSDFHQIRGEDGKVINFSQEVVIEKNVWLTNNITILKGVTIGEGALISSMSLIRKDIPAYALAGGIPAKVIKEGVQWNRDSVFDVESEV